MGVPHERVTCAFPGVAFKFTGTLGGAGTFTVTIVEWLRLPLVPVTVIVYGPACVPVGADIVKVDEVETSIELELRLAVNVAEEVVSATVPANPP